MAGEAPIEIWTDFPYAMQKSELAILIAYLIRYRGCEVPLLTAIYLYLLQIVVAVSPLRMPFEPLI